MKTLPALEARASEVNRSGELSVQIMSPAPWLPPVLQDSGGVQTDVGPSVVHTMTGLQGPMAEILSRVLAHRRQIAQVHRDHLTQQTAAHRQFLEGRQRALGILLGARSFSPSPGFPSAAEKTADQPSAIENARQSAGTLDGQSATEVAPHGPTFSRRDL